MAKKGKINITVGSTNSMTIENKAYNISSKMWDWGQVAFDAPTDDEILASPNEFLSSLDGTYQEQGTVLNCINFLSKRFLEIMGPEIFKNNNPDSSKLATEFNKIITFFGEKVDEVNIENGKFSVSYTVNNEEEKKEVIQEVDAILKGDLFLKILSQVPKKVWGVIQQNQEITKLKKENEKLKEEVKKKEGKVGKFKRSGHLAEQMLKYNYPKNRQPSLFDILQKDTLRDIEIAGVERTEIVEGIWLSPSETRVIDSLCKLLHETSQTSDPKKQDYYSGNFAYDMVEYGGEKTPAPELSFTLYELTKEYKGEGTIGGKDVENVRNILKGLDSKQFLLKYVETTTKKDGGRIERKIENYRKLITIIKISQTEFSKEDVELSKFEETVISLSPIFRRQINSKFILVPSDINRRTSIAYGNSKLSEATVRLRDWLMKERAVKRYTTDIYLDKLYYLLAEKAMNEKRKKQVKTSTEKAIKTAEALGLLLSYEITTGATGEPKITFIINKDWE